jgi:uncharacterized DUF497 family protein
MKIVWNEPKRLANIEHHGMDFADLDEAFFEDAVITPAKSRRLAAVGRHDSGVVLVIFTVLGTEAFSSISMRPASRNERRLIDE